MCSKHERLGRPFVFNSFGRVLGNRYRFPECRFNQRLQDEGMQDWFLYMIKCGDGSLYTGIAVDVARRFADHQTGKGAKYLRGRGPLQLVFNKRIGERRLALKLERRVKQLPRHKKQDLIQTGAGFDQLMRNLCG